MTNSPANVPSPTAGSLRPWLRLGAILVGLAFALGLCLGLGWPTDGKQAAKITASRIPEPPNSERTWTNPLSPAYLGDTACATCHAEQAERHRRSGHARTLWTESLADRFPDLVDRQAVDPERGASLRFAREGRDLVAEHSDGTGTKSLPMQFAVGSGNQAVTFVTLLPSSGETPQALEHRFSLYEQGKTLALTPSHRGEVVRDPIERFGRRHFGRDAQGCIDCHSTTGQIRGNRVDDLRPGVGCESCHGPGREHAAGMQNGNDVSAILFALGRETALSEIRMCGKCHRLPEMIVPPEPVTDPKLARFQPVGLLNSPCFQKSQGQLRCTTCHDPHAETERDPAHYVAICTKCHASNVPHARTCPQSATDRCIECHMPSIEVHPRVEFHDHWIRVRHDVVDPKPKERRP